MRARVREELSEKLTCRARELTPDTAINYRIDDLETIELPRARMSEDVRG
ncbi:hypothetical protein CBM2629_A80331 [Cupriavidus taiwanensis]|nr:hypothetical protein CBM2629_A80331 [Cupriavidus taiwanensis]